MKVSDNKIKEYAASSVQPGHIQNMRSVQFGDVSRVCFVRLFSWGLVLSESLHCVLLQETEGDAQ